ncbi:MAG: hypothetical protein WBE72_11990 [Terracidiphilus sp.]
MTNQAIARGLLAILCSLQGLATDAIDLNRTHATNPEWPGHARFHLVWQVVTVALLALLEVVLILSPGPLQAQRFYVAAILAAIPMLGFFAASVGKGLYRGASSDPDEKRPTMIVLPGSNLYVELNLLAEAAGVLALGVIVALYSYVSAAR